MLQEAELSEQADSENDLGGSSETMYFIGLDVHKKTISYCVKDAAGIVGRTLSLSGDADSENNLGGSSETMYFIGLDVHKKTISFCVKDAAGRVHQEGKSIDAPGTGRLDPYSAATAHNRHGGNHLHGMDL